MAGVDQDVWAKSCGSRGNSRVTRKSIHSDRSAGSQCHSVFTRDRRNLLGRADYGNATAEIKVVVVERRVEHTSHGATDGQQQHG